MSNDLQLGVDLDRLREGLLKHTRSAFRLLPKLKRPRILDIGCGSGVPTLELAKLSGGEVTGIDIDQSRLDRLARRIARAGLSKRVKIKNCSMFAMDFPDESFDIIWAEGSLAVIGFERGLIEWRRLLKPKGFLVVHAETSKTIDKLMLIPSLGYRLLNQLSLPEDAHWTDYYEPLESRIQELRAKYKNDPETLEELGKHQKEIDLVKRNPKEFSSAFYILRKL